MGLYERIIGFPDPRRQADLSREAFDATEAAMAATIEARIGKAAQLRAIDCCHAPPAGIADSRLQAHSTKDIPQEFELPPEGAARNSGACDLDPQCRYRAVEASAMTALRRSLRRASAGVNHPVSSRARESILLADTECSSSKALHYPILGLSNHAMALWIRFWRASRWARQSWPKPPAAARSRPAPTSSWPVAPISTRRAWAR